MNFATFLIIAVTTSAVAFIWQILFHVYPAYKRAKIAESQSILAKCVVLLNRDALLNAKICTGHYLHDKFYKLLFCVLTDKTKLSFNMLRHVKYDDKVLEERNKFRSEIDALDDATKQTIENATFSVAKVLILRNPLIFIMLLLRLNKVKRDFHEKKAKAVLRRSMIISTEYITVSSRDDDYSFVPC
jgi:hypothetical protein